MMMSCGFLLTFILQPNTFDCGFQFLHPYIISHLSNPYIEYNKKLSMPVV